MNNNQESHEAEITQNYSLFPLIIISAIVFGYYGIHDFLMKRYIYGFMHLLAFLAAFVISIITGNMLALIIVIPASYIIGLVEAFVYGQDFRKMKIQKTTNMNDNANKNSNVQFSDNAEEIRIADEKAILDKQLAEGKIDGIEYNRRVIELTVPEEPKPSAKKSNKLAGILWLLSLFSAAMIVWNLYEGSKSASDGALPEAFAIFLFTPLTIILVIVAIIVTASNSK